jgi:orotate phosphoribosyltransferase
MNVLDLPNARDDLLGLLRTKAFEERDVTLASGRKSRFYIDCKQVTLDAVGHVLVGRLLLDEILRYMQRTGRDVRGVGGLTLGADPIASAVSLTSALLDHPIPALIVRKEAKGHGTGAFLEGARNVGPGAEVAIVEDVVTTGGSAMKAVERVRDGGFRVGLVLGLVDRLEGGREAIEGAGLELVTLFDRRDFIDDARSNA